ncbi:Nucleotidylyl transferase [Obba rivulosa]|uniref:Nucleotidylyl transferase n=1 Tax=Obba rivulosa TaxID=1052685 RepID=A0A8E2AY27_9APHY|nr:Nucleotidylyl transferase [Obba rivulosa]
MSYFSALIQRVHDGISPVELAYASNELWPLPPNNPVGATLHVSVLDSSFNPPTLAHLALARSQPPPSLSSDAPPADYDARLLLLSVRNADKELKPGDASYVQRLEMMCLFAQDVGMEQNRPPNVAVAVINEPTFGDTPKVQLTFLTGMDTLVRLFSPRYYPSEEAMRESLHHFLSDEGDDSRVVCARRTVQGTFTKGDQEQQLPETAKEFVESHRVAIINISERERGISSTEVRQLIARGDNAWRSLVTPAVAEYIAEHNIYRS